MYKVGKVAVTREIAFVGMRVGRGPDWSYDNQDIVAGQQVAGTIAKVGETSATVNWDRGLLGYYYSIAGKYDLSLWEGDIIPVDPLPIDAYEKLRVKRGTDLKAGDTVCILPDSGATTPLKSAGITTLRIWEYYTVVESSLSGDRVKIAGYKSFIPAKAVQFINSAPTTFGGRPFLSSAIGIDIGTKLILGMHRGDSENSNIMIGEEVTVAVSGSFNIQTSKRDGWWVPINCFVMGNNPPKVEEIRKELQYEMTLSGPKKKSNTDSISSHKKSTEHVGTINVTGHIIKVRRASWKIERGERVRGILIQG